MASSVRLHTVVFESNEWAQSVSSAAEVARDAVFDARAALHRGIALHVQQPPVQVRIYQMEWNGMEL
jgi:hypothetical protein